MVLAPGACPPPNPPLPANPPASGRGRGGDERWEDGVARIMAMDPVNFRLVQGPRGAKLECALCNCPAHENHAAGVRHRTRMAWVEEGWDGEEPDEGGYWYRRDGARRGGPEAGEAQWSRPRNATRPILTQDDAEQMVRVRAWDKTTKRWHYVERYRYTMAELVQYLQQVAPGWVLKRMGLTGSVAAACRRSNWDKVRTAIGLVVEEYGGAAAVARNSATAGASGSPSGGRTGGRAEAAELQLEGMAAPSLWLGEEVAESERLSDSSDEDPGPPPSQWVRDAIIREENRRNAERGGASSSSAWAQGQGEREGQPFLEPEKEHQGYREEEERGPPRVSSAQAFLAPERPAGMTAASEEGEHEGSE